MNIEKEALEILQTAKDLRCDIETADRVLKNIKGAKIYAEIIFGDFKKGDYTRSHLKVELGY